MGLSVVLVSDFWMGLRPAHTRLQYLWNRRQLGGEEN